MRKYHPVKLIGLGNPPTAPFSAKLDSLELEKLAGSFNGKPVLDAEGNQVGVLADCRIEGESVVGTVVLASPDNDPIHTITVRTGLFDPNVP